MDPPRVHAWKVGTLALAALAACSSGLDPGADVRVAGQLVAEDGSPVAGASVLAVRKPGSGDAIPPDLRGGVLSLACLDDPEAGGCSPAHQATTGDDGRFELRLRGADTQGADGQAADLDLSARLEARGPSVSVRLRVERERVDVGRLALWSGAGDATAVLYERPDGERVWESDGRGGADDRRVLEDASGDAFPVRRAGAVTQRGVPSPFAGSARPPTRGARCVEPAGFTSPCALTDGDYASPFRARTAATCAAPGGGFGGGCAGQGGGWVGVDLVAVRTPSLAVVRGAPVPYGVQVSVDGQSWETVAQGPAGDAALPLAPAVAQWVKLQPSRGGMTGTRELSVW